MGLEIQALVSCPHQASTVFNDSTGYVQHEVCHTDMLAGSSMPITVCVYPLAHSLD